MSGVDINTIYNQLNYLDETKQQLRTALINKGQTVPVSQPFRNYVDNINNLGNAKIYGTMEAMYNDTSAVDGTFGTVYNGVSHNFEGIYSYSNIQHNWLPLTTQFNAEDNDVLSVAYMGKNGPSVGNLDALKEYDYSNQNNAKKYIGVARTIMTSIDTSKSNNIKPLVEYAKSVGTQHIDFLIVGNNCNNAYDLFSYVNGVIATNNWDTSNVINMANMFQHSSYLYNVNTSRFNTDNVNNMANMFRDCERLQDVAMSGWNVAKVTSMSDMFQNCHHLQLFGDYMPQNCYSLVNVTNMFRNCFSIPVLYFNTFGNCNAVFADNMFNNCTSLKYIDEFEVDNIVQASGMFCNCDRLIYFTNSTFNLSQVKNCQEMFYNCRSLKNNVNNTINIYGQLECVENMTNMFGLCSNLSRINFVGGINTENLTKIGSCFNGCTNLSNVSGFNFNFPNITGQVVGVFNDTKVSEYDMRNCYSPNVTVLMNFFSKNYAGIIRMDNCIMNNLKELNLASHTNLKTASLSNVYMPNLTKLSFYNDIELQDVQLTTNTPIYLTQANLMFSNCKKLTSLSYYNGFNVSLVTNFSSMFYNCSNLTYAGLIPYFGWEVSNAVNMSSMFAQCSRLNSLPVLTNSNNVTDVSSMFANCVSLSSGTLYNSYINMISVVNARNTFEACSSFTTFLNFNLCNVELFRSGFNKCYNLTDVNITNLANCYEMLNCFQMCYNLKNVSIAGISSANNCRAMFKDCYSLENLTFDNCDFSTSNDMSEMFANCRSLTELPEMNIINCVNTVDMFTNAGRDVAGYVNVKEYDTSNVTNMARMFANINNDKLDDDSIQNIINMCINSNVTNVSLKSLYPNNIMSPIVSTGIPNTRYQNRWEELASAGWSY